MAGDGGADLPPHPPETLDAEAVHQGGEVVDDAVDRPRIVARHRRGSAKAPHVGAYYTKMACECRHPGEPHRAALAVSVQEQYGFGLAPGIGIVVHEVV